MPFAHAEMMALADAGETLGRWRFDDCALYVTLEPCPMCAGAVVQTRVKTLVFGAADPRAGACGSLYDIVRDPRASHRCAVRGGVMSDECAELLREFFASRRK
jgi:tRNA(adenine34) deaminase